MKSAWQRHSILRRASGTPFIVRTLNRAGVGLFLVLFVLGAILYTRVGGGASVYAATSSTLNFQSRLLQSSGALVADGTYNIEFKIYDSLSAGASAQGVCAGGATDDCQWMETRTSADKVTLKNGYLSVNLGSVTSLPSINWDQDLYLTMNIGGTGTPAWDGEMSPRIKLTSVPFALDSGKLGGLDKDKFAQLAPSSVQAVNAALAVLRINQTGTGLLAQLQGDGSDVFTVSKTGAVTGGTYNTSTLTGSGLTFGSAATATVQSASNQALTIQSQGTGVLSLTSGSGTVVLGSNILQNVSSAMTLDVSNAGLSTFNIVNNNGTNLANLDVEGGIFAGNGNAFSVNSDGDLTAVFTALNGTSTANGEALIASTSLTLTSAANFDIGNYVQMNSANCGGTGVNVCYAKVTAKATNTLTITPALTWASGATVNEYHVPELGGTNTSEVLTSRYGRGYFIAGVATGNGTTYYNENSIETSLNSFNLLNTGVATLNIGGSATTITLGSTSTNVNLPGSLSLGGLERIDETGALTNIASLTGSGVLTISSAASGDLTLTSSSGLININAGTMRRTAAGLTTLDLVDTANTTLAFTNSGTGVLNLTVDGSGSFGAGLTVTSGGLSVTGNSTITGSLSGLTGLTVVSGGASITGGLNNNSGGITNTGSIANATTLSLSGAITGATTTNTINGLIINAGTLSGITTISMSGAITAATATNTINGLIINSGALTGVANITFSSGNTITSSANANLTLEAQGTGSLVFTGYNCSGLSNGGTLTTNSSGVVSCQADDAGLSDARLKENVADLNDDILGRIKDVRTVNFDFDCDQQYFKEQILDCRTDRQTGIIAQELEQIFPELVYDGEDGYKRVDFKALNFYNLKAVSELATMLNPNGDAKLSNIETGGVLRLSSTGTLQNITGLNIVSGGATISGNVNVTNGLYQINGVNGASVSCTNNNVRGTFTGGIATSLSCAGLSDIRLKENVVALDSSVLDKIGDINTVSFDFKCSDPQYAKLHLDCSRQTGVMAQELAQVFPELVYQGEDGFYRVKYDALNIYTLKAVGELAKERKSQTVTADTTGGVQTGGTMRLDSNGVLQNITGLQMISGGASVAGGINNNGGGITNIGSINGATTIEAQSIQMNATGTNDLLTLKKDGQGVFTVFNNGALQLKLDSASAFSIKDLSDTNIFTIDSINGRVSIGDGNESKTVLFTLDNLALPEDPPGTNGSSYYNTVFERFRCYENNKWRDCLPAGDLTDSIALDRTTWTLLAADQEFQGTPRIIPNLTFAHEFRLRMRVTSASASASACRLEYALTDEGPWKNLAKDAPGELSIARAGTLKTDWLKIAEEARAEEAIIRVMCRGGDGRAVTFYGVSMQLR